MSGALEGLELRSTATEDGLLRLTLEPVTVGEPGADEVIVQVEAAPINPSDLGLLLGPADMTTIRAEGTAERPVLVADIPPHLLRSVTGRLGQSLPVGNEGAGTVVRAGANVADMLGRKVGMVGGAMFAQYRKVHARACMPLPEGASVADGAAMFVNPLTALGFVETMKAEGHKAIVHTAAASNLGQMLNKICQADGIALVNIVRSDAQVAMLREIGAQFVLDSTAPDFQAQLVDAIGETGATIGFDAIGGGKLAGQILNAMEAAAGKRGGSYSIYGNNSPKQVYIYGSLDTGPTVLNRAFGLSWGLGGWLLTNFLQKIGPDAARLRQRVSEELKTTFASHYTQVISLADALRPEIVAAYQKKATGEKYLINPTL